MKIIIGKSKCNFYAVINAFRRKSRNYHYRKVFCSYTSLSLVTTGLSASIIFQADFNGNSGGTGGAQDIVSKGGSGQLFSYTDAVTEVTAASPGLGDGGYLSVSVPSESVPTDGYLGGVIFYPASKRNSWAAFQEFKGDGCLHLNGAVDFFFLVKDPGKSGFSTDWTRILEVGSPQNGNLRMIVSAQFSDKLRVLLTNASGDGLITESGAKRANIVLDADLPRWHWEKDVVYHFAITLSTDRNGYVTLNIYGNFDGSDLSTEGMQHLMGSCTFIVDASVVTSGFPEGEYKFNIGGASSSGNAAGRKVEADCFRLYNDVPDSFSGIGQ